MARLTDGAQRLGLYLLLAQLGLVSLLWNSLAAALHPLLPRRTGTRLGRSAIAKVYGGVWRNAQALGLMRMEVADLQALNAEPGGLIVAANHPTMLDALVLVSQLPRGVCIMKADLMRNAFLGAGARMARYIRNDSPLGMVRAAVACLHEGGQLIMFPEGTRTTHPPINRFHPGISLIAKRAQVPIQTVLIETDSSYLRKGWPLWRPPRFPVVIRARLGARFVPQADSAALLDDIERYFKQSLAAAPLPQETGP